MLCQTPDWLQYVILGLAVVPHVLPFVPAQYQGLAGTLYKIVSTLAGNYGHCTNASAATPVVDEQDKVTPRP